MKNGKVYFGIWAVVSLLSFAIYYAAPYIAKNKAFENKHAYWSVVLIERGYDKNEVGQSVRLGLQKARFERTIIIDRDGTRRSFQSYSDDRDSRIDFYLEATKKNLNWKNTLKLAEEVEVRDFVFVHVQEPEKWIDRIDAANYYMISDVPWLK